jgi:hypothetical protein
VEMVEVCRWQWWRCVGGNGGGDVLVVGIQAVVFRCGSSRPFAALFAWCAHTVPLILLLFAPAHFLRNVLSSLLCHVLSSCYAHQYLNRCDQVLILKEGHVVGAGPFRQLMRENEEFAALLMEHEGEDTSTTKVGDGVAKR